MKHDYSVLFRVPSDNGNYSYASTLSKFYLYLLLQVATTYDRINILLIH
jgi:hypothetical protein